MKINNKDKNKEKGFVLVTVMLLTMMAGTVVLTSLQDSTVQERLTGNFQKKINSRLMAEKGVYNSLTEMNTQLAQAPTLTVEQLKTKMEASEVMSGGDATTTYGLIITENPDNPNEISVVSTGESYEGQVKLKAIYELVTGAVSSGNSTPPSTGVVACKAISVAGSGTINSFDSSQGLFSNANSGDDVTVQTIAEESAIEFVGGTKIHGNVIGADTISFNGSASISGNMESIGAINASTGANVAIGGNISTLSSFSQENGSVGGSIHANGAIKLTQTPVGGNITSGATVSLSGNRVSGYVLASSDVTLDGASVVSGGVKTNANYIHNQGTVYNDVRAVGNVTIAKYNHMITSSVIYGGIGKWGDADNAFNPFTYTVTSPAPEPADVPIFETSILQTTSVAGTETTSCDPDGIESQVSGIESGITSARNLILTTNGDAYLMNALDADFTKTSGREESTLRDIQNPDTLITQDLNVTENTAISAIFQGDRKNILTYTSISNDGDLTIGADQDVTIYVQGDFVMGNVATLNIPKGSTLTLIIAGKVNIGQGAKVNIDPDGQIVDGKPVFSIYSSYESTYTDDDEDLGIYFSGGTETAYAVIYAPLADIEIASAVSFSGSVYGNNVTVSGVGGVHYDTQLGNINSDSSDNGGATAALVFKGWEYITEDDDEDDDDSKS